MVNFFGVLNLYIYYMLGWFMDLVIGEMICYEGCFKLCSFEFVVVFIVDFFVGFFFFVLFLGGYIRGFVLLSFFMFLFFV